MNNSIAILALFMANVLAMNVSHAQVSNEAPINATPVEPPESQTPGSDPDFVWVNKNSHTYLCPADRWYGKTKNGEYMSEWNAKALGYRAKHNKKCNI